MTVSFDLETERADISLLLGAEDCTLLAVTITTVFDLPDGWKTRGWPKWKRYCDRQSGYREQILEDSRNCRHAPGKRARETLFQEAAWYSS